MAMRRILFVCRPQHVSGLHAALKEQGVSVILAEDMPTVTKTLAARQVALAVCETGLPGLAAAEVVAAAVDHEVPVVVVAERGSADEVRQYLGLGARDYWLLPLLAEKLLAALPEPGPPAAVGASAARAFGAPVVVGSHPAMGRILALARQVARSKATVLVSGESGTGKEVLARYIHAHSGRQGPFVAVNCAALPEHLLESELFGHEKGAFTGAIARKLGKFELASGGTLLLDEISEMDLALQAKLLRALQEGEIDRVGGTESVAVDTRVIATTNRNLEEAVAQGQFRQDLFYRLNVIPLRLPPLRERGADVLELARFFLRRFADTYGYPSTRLSAEAERWLQAHQWPGNVRELQNLMERAVLLAAGGAIGVGHFLLDSAAGEDVPVMEGEAPVQSLESASSEGAGDEPEIIPLEEMERRLILKSLRSTGGNRTKASELLGISVRTLRNKLNEYRLQGIAVP
ncbi:sigma-54-dependent Fis family transcriptional regulator [Thermodesulfomicrobium sp. WS]|uniref:sigma-54 interaction domain-containing protein n=1 Tax=Thermodesulfomicrobium sp. WS TaxID=3004129 RepID=UPI002493B9F7|nr:sigma-54 dependent transcriptional regulator [Thermodesulfomicrobium sp. WS]BDV00041.1 sigma-54-dependent Fis family transcriptional regulator [Thermodesulfomicrobium sp. WS]